MKKLKWIILVAPAVCTLMVGYTIALLSPLTGERIRSTVDVASQQWCNGEISKTEKTEVEHLLLESAALKGDLTQALIDLGDCIKLIDSARGAQLHAEERAQVAEELSEVLIQDQLARPMLMLAPTPQEIESEPEPESQEASTISIGAQKKPNEGT